MARGAEADSKVTIEAGVLAKAMKHAASIVEARNTIPIFANVRLVAEGDSIEIVTTDLDVEFRQTLPLTQPGALATTVDAKRLAAVVQSVDEKALLTLELEGARLTVKAGRSRWQLPCLPVADFPVFSEHDYPAEVEIAGAALADAIARTIWACGTDLHRVWSHGPLLHAEAGKVALVATDGLALMRVVTAVDYPDGAPQVIVGPKHAKAVQSLAGEHGGPVTIRWSERRVRAEIGATVLTGKTLDAEYAEYRRAMFAFQDAPLLADPALLRGALRRVQLVASERTRSVKLERAADKLTLSVNALDSGTAREEVPANASEGPDQGFRVELLDPLLAAVGGETIEIHPSENPPAAMFRRAVDDGALGILWAMKV